MSNTKHTPGEWKYRRSNSKSAFNVVNTTVGYKYKIAICPYIGETATEYLDKNIRESEANAKLIAAAPDLLEACKAAIDSNTDWDNTIFIIEAAIKKATI